MAKQKTISLKWKDIKKELKELKQYLPKRVGLDLKAKTLTLEY